MNMNIKMYNYTDVYALEARPRDYERDIPTRMADAFPNSGSLAGPLDVDPGLLTTSFVMTLQALPRRIPSSHPNVTQTKGGNGFASLETD